MSWEVDLERFHIMRCVCSATLAACLIVVPASMLAAGLAPANVTVGQHLEVAATVALSEPAPAEGLQVTLTSDDPTLVLLSSSPENKGTASIVVSVRPGRRDSSEFYVQGLGKTATATYTASAPGALSGTGTVTIAPSGIIITTSAAGTLTADSIVTGGPLGSPKIRVYSALLDSSLHYVSPQLVAGGSAVSVKVTSSDSTVGAVALSTLTIAGGNAFALTQFQPKAAGTTKLAVDVPEGFSAPARFGQLKVTVSAPVITAGEQVSIGKNLQGCATVFLSQPPPKEGLVITLTSDNPQLLFSATGADPGSKSLTITMPEGHDTVQYCMQSLADTGVATVTASAPGYSSRPSTVALTPSGVLMGFVGPPDEADMFRKEAAEREHGIVVDLSQKHATLTLYMARLHPVHHRGADITVQGLRPGVSATVELQSSDPSVGTITSPVIISGTEATAKFTAHSVGKTVISMKTPEGFTTTGNANSFTVIVK